MDILISILTVIIILLIVFIIFIKQGKQEVEDENKQRLEKEIQRLIQQKSELMESIEEKKEILYSGFTKEKEQIEAEIANYKTTTNNAKDSYIENLEKAYDKAENLYKDKVAALGQEYEEQMEKMQELQNSINAGLAAQLREREKEDKIAFYTLHLADGDLSDILILNSIKPKLNQPVILSKLIWSTYFQKQTNELCNRVFGSNVICGIYKITNLKTKQCYIGQSKNIQNRIKTHIKCGLGIEASSTNKLYKAMQEEGVWNFSFELLEECPPELLNEKEKLWIQVYQADIYSYNSTKGNE